jgi:hypothetical protein
MAKAKKGKQAKATKTEQPATKTGLSLAELRQLSDRLLGSSLHVYRTAEKMFGREFGDDIFDDLKVHCGLQKCEECNEWKLSDQFERGFETCSECLDRIDCDDDEE